MKYLFLLTALFLFIEESVSAQGLEGIKIEKYYISDSNDAAFSNGALPVGSVTYRLYADMKPGYRFQAVYGVPGHPMQISTSTVFFNDTVLGSTVAEKILPGYLNSGLLMLDTWLSVGASAENNYGVLKTSDTTDAIQNKDHVVQNTDVTCGVPVKLHDGMFYASPLPVTLIYGIDSTQLAICSSNIEGADHLYTENGSWACLAGAIGPDSSNKVLIGQFTTNGLFSFKLNIQIGTPAGTSENYVASDPTGEEIIMPSLIYPAKKSDTNSNGF